MKLTSGLIVGKKNEMKTYKRGDSVKPSDLGGGQDEYDELVADDILVSDKQYDRLFPEMEEGENQPMGTPSNLPNIERDHPDLTAEATAKKANADTTAAASSTEKDADKSTGTEPPKPPVTPAPTGVPATGPSQ
jgi:hypothetical protein